MRHLATVWVALACGAAATAQRADLLAAARQAQAEGRALAQAKRDGHPPATTAVVAFAERVDALVLRLRGDWPTWPMADIARATMCLHEAFGALDRNSRRSSPAFDLLEAELRARPDAIDGWGRLLIARGAMARDVGNTVEVADAWDGLWRRATGAKRIWLACEGARVLLNKCGQPARAEAILSEALADLVATPDWGEATRLAVLDDPDVWITAGWRPRAGTWREARGQALLLRGFAREQMGSLVPALADLAAAREDFAWSRHEHRLVNCDHNLASIWLQLGRFDLAAEVATAAEVAYAQGFLLAAADGPRERDGNGRVAMRKLQAQALLLRDGPGDVAAAAAILEAALVDPELSLPQDTNLDVCTSLAEALLRLPDAPDRGARIAAVLDRVDLVLGAASDAVLRWRAELLRAELDLQRGDVAAARARALAVAEPLARHRHRPLQVRRLALLGRCELAAGAPAAALAAFAAAADVVGEAVLAEEMWRLDGAASAFAAQFGELLAGAKAAFDAAVAAADPAAMAQLYALVQRFHGFEALCRSLVVTADVPSADDAALAQQVRGARATYAELLRRQPLHPLAQRERLRRLAAAQREVESTEAALAARRRGTAGSSTAALAAPATLAEAQAALGPGEVLVECVEAAGASFAFVVTVGGTRIEPLPAGTNWRADIAALRAFCGSDDGATDAAAVPALAAAAAALLPPGGWFDRLLAGGDVARVLWSPEGSFAQVPVAALPWQGRPLVAAVEVGHVVSGTWLARQRAAAIDRRPRADLRLLALANPRYPAARVQQLAQRSLVDAGGFAPLPAAAEEALGVAAHFADAAEQASLRAIAAPARFDGELRGGRYRVLLGGAATETALARAALRDVDVLHLACHGEAQPDAPAMSFLALSLPDADAATTAADDGLLRAGELGRLRGDYELVVLSACGSAAGARRGHDAVAGLAWSAQIAGARRVLASQWRVPDVGARNLVGAFFDGWRRDGAGAAAALAAAQRHALGARPVREWAAFAVWGEPQ
ncbi:MAG: CHAT domain-containing protein [Planctomycetota bacterium]